MTRNLDIIRYILIEIEKAEDYYVDIDDLITDTYSGKLISHHTRLLMDCGYLEAIGSGVIGAEYEAFMIKRITSSGYDYLDNVRNNKVWEETKKQLLKFGASSSLDIVKTVANKIILDLIGI